MGNRFLEILNFDEEIRCFEIRTNCPRNFTKDFRLKPGVHRDAMIYYIPEIYWESLKFNLVGGVKDNKNLLENYVNYEEIYEKILPLKGVDSIHPAITAEEYQLRGASWLAQKSGRLINDTMGLGKTLTVLLAFKHLYNTGQRKKLFVFCPKRAIKTWQDEWEKHIGNSIPETNFYVTNYDQVKSKNSEEIKKELKNPEDIVLAFDEIHNLAGRYSKRFKAIKSLTFGKPFHKIALTGTFIRNKINSFFAPYILLADAEVSYTHFLKEFGEYEHCYNQLKAVFHQFGIRRTYEDVDINVPRSNVTMHNIVMGSKQKKVYNGLKKKIKAKIKELKSEKVTSHHLALMTKQMSICSHPAIYEDSFPDKDVSKIAYLEELLSDIDEKVLVWSMHPKTLYRLQDYFKTEYDPIVLEGSLSEKEFNNRFIQFINNPEHKMLCLSIGACNQALDGLQFVSHNAIYFDIGWKTTEFIQSRGRIYRKGQKNITNHHYLIYTKT
ncbi:MAG: SNF2-related protein, partial [Vulcanimicrobiota bacterium]